MIVRALILVLILYMSALAGCYTSKSAYDNFDRILATLVDKPYEQAFHPESGLLRGLEPSEINKLEEHRELHVFRNYFSYRAVDRRACDIFVTIDAKTNTVVAAKSDGKGCYMPY